MKAEMNSLEKNQTWVLTKLPEGKKALQNKWVYRVKEEHDDKKKYKARLVVKGFQQWRGIDYTKVFTLGGTTVSWMSRLQKSVSFSTTEAEYIAISEAAKKMIWLKNFLKELGKEHNSGALFSDSQSAIHLTKNPVFHARTKHIQLRYHHIGRLVEVGQ